MNKKANTLLFILGATVFNMLITILCFFALLMLYAKTVMPFIPEDNRAWGFPIIFLAAIALAFLIYRFVLKVFLKKVDVERYFDPIFGKRK